MSIWDSISSTVGNVTNAVNKTYQDAEKLVKDTSHKIHIANNLSEDVFVFVAPNKDWAFADLMTDAVLASSTLSLIGLAKSVAEFTALSLQISLYRSTIDSQNEQVKNAVKAFFENFASRLPAQEVEQVFGQTKLNPVKYLSTSTYGALLSASNMSIIIVTPSLSKAVAFNTNSDWSWIVTDEGIVRAQYGKLWQEDRDAGFYSWGTNNLL